MFVRLKKSGRDQYVQLVENRRKGAKINQRVIATLGRLETLQASANLERVIRSLARFADPVVVVFSGKRPVTATARKIGPALIFERLWRELGMKQVFTNVLRDRKFGFAGERAIFLTVLHRLFMTGSDRCCEKWRRDDRIEGTAELSLHQLYRAMAFLGEELTDQQGAMPFSPRCTKDVVEEALFFERHTLFRGLDLVFFAPTSISFEGEGGTTLGQKGQSKEHRPDRNQLVIGALLDEQGNPICCELWPGNTTDVTTLIAVTDRIRQRFKVGQFCIVADRGMISAEPLKALEARKLAYILGTRMRNVTEISRDVLSRAGRYQDVCQEGRVSTEPAPLKVKEVWGEDPRYIVCLNPRQARKEAQDRQTIIAAFHDKLRTNPKSFIGNTGYRKYLRLNPQHLTMNEAKVEAEARFDGKWVLRTNTDLPAEQVAITYKELWQVEQTFRDVNAVLETRPIFHQRDDTIRGHIFCSFLALILKKDLTRRLEQGGDTFEWTDIKQDLNALQEIVIDDQGASLAIRSECLGTCGKVFQAVGVALPPTIRELSYRMLVKEQSVVPRAF